MKKKIITLLAAAAITIILAGCGTSDTNSDETFFDNYFTVIKDEECWTLMYANDTKVMYLTYHLFDKFDITPLFNPDGTLQLYGEGEGE